MFLFQNHPVSHLFIEIQSRHIEFYSATLMINAHLSGLRYIMFNWPILSTIVGIGTNLFFITLVCTLSYIHFTAEEENSNENFTYEKCELDDEHDLKVNDCKLFYNLYAELFSFYSKKEILHRDDKNFSFQVSDTSSQEDTSSSMVHLKDDTEQFKGEPSYIQEISTLIAESSSAEVSKWMLFALWNVRISKKLLYFVIKIYNIYIYTSRYWRKLKFSK